MASNSEDQLPTTSSTTSFINESELTERKQIGHGSFGDVFSANWNGTTVAVKVFKDKLGQEKDLKMYNNEVDKSAKLKHKNVVKSFGKTQIDGKNAFVMELGYCPSKKIIHNKYQTYSEREALNWFTEIVEAVEYMHGKGIIHRDLKTDNVIMFFQPDGSLIAKIADFGISRQKPSTNSNLTANAGTPNYMAPEVIKSIDGRVKYDHKCDVWSLGVIGSEFYYRRVPFAEFNCMQILYRVGEFGCRPTDSYPRFICPDDIRTLIDKCLEEDYTKRIELANVLNGLKASTSTSTAEIISMKRAVKNKTTASSIDKWYLLMRLPDDIKIRVRLASVLGFDYNFEAVFITDDDEAYWVKANPKSWRLRNEGRPKRIDGFSGKKVKSLVNSSCTENSRTKSCFLALTKDGRLLVWCSDGDKANRHPLARIITCNDDDDDGEDNVTAIVSNYIGQTIVEVACGNQHALALTKDGEVWSWGENYKCQVGLGTSDDDIHLVPVQVTERIGSRPAVAVACGKTSSYAVMDTGDVYCWGWDRWREADLGQASSPIRNLAKSLGFIDDARPFKVPTKVAAFSGFRRLVTGFNHVLVLTDDGSMYAWGENYRGQLGTGDKNKRKKPVRVGPSGVKFIEVAANSSSNPYRDNNLSAALSDDGRVWVWGWCRDEFDSREGQFLNVRYPKPVESESIQDAIADYAELQNTWKTMVIRQQ